MLFFFQFQQDVIIIVINVKFMRILFLIYIYIRTLNTSGEDFRKQHKASSRITNSVARRLNKYYSPNYYNNSRLLMRLL